MKNFVYIPFLAFASILYTRLSINSGEFQPEAYKGRAPASVGIENSSLDFHRFYRANTKLFYSLSNEMKVIEKFKNLSNYHSTMAGDVHVENFGMIGDDHFRYALNLNDVDETTEAPVFYDVLRHFISVDITIKTITWNDYLKYYKKGLKGEAITYSFPTLKLQENARAITNAFLNKSIDSKLIRFKKKKITNRNLTKKEAADLKKVLLEKFPDAEFFDQYVALKKNSGSAGRLRFEILVRLSPLEKVQWLELKEEGISSFDQINNIPDVPYESRLNHLKESFYEGKFENTFTTLNIDGKPFLVKPIENLAVKINLSDVEEADLSDIVLDEAYVLGKLHSLSLKAKGLEPEAMAKDLEAVPYLEFKKTSDELKEQLKKKYQEEVGAKAHPL